MIGFIIRRIAIMIPLLFVVSIITFTVIKLPPGDFMTTYLSNMAMAGDPAVLEQVDQLRAHYGLDKPLVVQYLRWFGGLLRGDLGYSLMFERPVNQLIGERLALTTAISFCALLLAWLLAIPIGMYSAVRPKSAVDYLASFFGLIGLATPPFLLALVLLFLANRYLGMTLGGLFSEKYMNAGWSWGKFGDLLKHMWLPVGILTVTNIGALIRTVRANLLDQLEMPYVDTARAKGLPEWRLILKYPARIALNPLISTIGWMLPAMISATAIVDIVLSLPTTGPLLLQSLLSQDMYLAGALVMLLSVLTMIGSLISDLLLAWVDPRIRFEGGAR